MKKKIVLLGDGGVGKTSLVRRFVEQTFSDDYIATIGVNVKKKRIEDLDLTMSIWDIFGQRKMSERPREKHYLGADGALVVFDLVRKRTFDDLNDWVSGLLKVTGRIPIIVLGNKYDLITDFMEQKKMRVSESSPSVFRRFMKENHPVRSVYRGESDHEAVSQWMAKEWIDRWQAKMKKHFGYLNTSAKTGKNVEKAFRLLGETLVG